MPSLLFAAPLCSRISHLPTTANVFSASGASVFRHDRPVRRRGFITEASEGVDASPAGESVTEGRETQDGDGAGKDKSEVGVSNAPYFFPTSTSSIDMDIKKVVQKTATTFAPRASNTGSKNPAVPGTTLYTVFEVQGYASMFVGGALSFNLLFPSSEPDIWRLMGMWSIWMFTIPSLRARDCSKNEKEALNYLFVLVPLLNVIIPFFWKSFAVVWSADTLAFFLMYTWKMGWWIQKRVN